MLIIIDNTFFLVDSRVSLRLQDESGLRCDRKEHQEELRGRSWLE